MFALVPALVLVSVGLSLMLSVGLSVDAVCVLPSVSLNWSES